VIILSSNKHIVVDTAKYGRLYIQQADPSPNGGFWYVNENKVDAVLLFAAGETEQIVPQVIGRFTTLLEAEETLLEIVEAVENEEKTFLMPGNHFDKPMPKIQDARIRRKGGS
jgi:hypothetical protein